MKTLFTIFVLSVAFHGFSQQDSTKTKRQISVKSEAVERRTTGPVKVCNPATIIYGSFIVDSYLVMGDRYLNQTEIDLLVGSLIKIAPTAITGEEIDPMSMEVYEIEKMTSEDYIYRVFGSTLKENVSSLPYLVKVHKTSNTDCYGILDLGSGKVAIPYKGVLLFLKKK